MEKAEKARKDLAKAMKVKGGNMDDAKKFLSSPRAATIDDSDDTTFLEFVETEKNMPRRPKVGTIVTCKFTGVPDLMSNFVGSNEYYGRHRLDYFQHLFVGQECTGGKLPDPRLGDWVSSLAISHACGEPEQWSIISPNEQDGPGVMFNNRKPCLKNGAIIVQVDFFLPDQKKYAKDYHRCVWQGMPERLTQPNPGKGESFAGYSKLMALRSWWTATPEEQIAARDDPGKMDEDSGGILKKFKLSSDPRAWSEHSNAEFPGAITAASPGYHRHIFTKEDCTNGHPPTDRKCFVSMRWGESCGGDRDWRALHNFNGKESDVPAGVEWYTGNQCESARVAVDYFCPKKNKDFNAENEVYTCKYQGEGDISSCGTEERHANDPQAGYCRHHKFTAEECGGKLPATDKHADSCIVSMREFVQCGEGQDFSATIGKDGNAEVSWYTAGWSKTRAGSSGNCSAASIVVDYMCPGECNRKCINGKLDSTTCNCKCNAGWSGRDCQSCGIEQSDCLHGSTFDPMKCMCRPAANGFWGGVFSEKCTLTQESCKNGGTFDAKSCKCIQCNEGYRGKLCTECNRVQDQCKQGATLDTNTCKCSIDCPTGGIFCEECPKGDNGEACSGFGQCKNSKCVCQQGHVGKVCSDAPVKATCSVKTGNVVPFQFKSKNGNAIVKINQTGEYNLFEVAKKAKSELTSVHGYYHKVGKINLLIGIFVEKVTDFEFAGKSERGSLRIIGKKDSDSGVDITRDCEDNIDVKSLWVSDSRKKLRIKSQGKTSFLIESDDKQLKVSVDQYKCDYGTCLSASIDIVDDAHAYNFYGMCALDENKGYLLENQNHQLLQCRETKQEINLRFKSINGNLLRGQGNAAALSYRFQQVKHDWDQVDWDAPTPAAQSAESIIEPVTSFSLIPKDCHSITASSAELECRVHLPESFPEGFIRSDPALSPYTSCVETLCDEGNPEKAHNMAKLETLKAKRKRQQSLEDEAVKKQLDAEYKVASNIASIAEMADVNDGKC
jgi:hypothetical protein